MENPQEIEFARLLFGGIAAMVSLALIIVVFAAIYQRKVHNQQSELQVRELHYRGELLEAIVKAQEAERQRIARDLHDEVGASLSTARMLVKQIGFETSVTEIQNLASQSGDVMAAILTDVRHISHNLSPVILETYGFLEAVKRLLKLLDSAGLSTKSVLEYEQNMLSEYEQLIAYRIIQELLNNVIRHSEATEINFSLKREGVNLEMLLSDNGKGFLVGQNAGGLGMKTIQTRARLLNADLVTDSSPGNGTLTKLTIPLKTL